MNDVLKNRLKSFAWRLGMMIVAACVNFTLANIGDFHMGAQTTVIVGLVLGEISKYLNTKE